MVVNAHSVRRCGMSRAHQAKSLAGASSSSCHCTVRFSTHQRPNAALNQEWIGPAEQGQGKVHQLRFDGALGRWTSFAAFEGAGCALVLTNMPPVMNCTM